MLSRQPKASYKEWLYLNTRLHWIYDDALNPEALNTQIYITHMAAWYLRKGSVRVDIDGTRAQAHEGQWLILKPGLRKQHFSSDAHILSVHFQANWPNGENLFNKGLSLVIKGEDFPNLEKQAHRLLLANRRITPQSNDQISWARVEELNRSEVGLSEFLRMQKPFTDWLCAYYETLIECGIFPSRVGDVHENVLEGLRIIEHMPKDHPFDRAKFASQIGLSVTHADRLFIQHEGKTAAKAFEDSKLRYAREQLSLGTVSIKRVSLELGFTDLSNFSRWFKRLTGDSPRQFQTLYAPKVLD